MYRTRALHAAADIMFLYEARYLQRVCSFSDVAFSDRASINGIMLRLVSCRPAASLPAGFSASQHVFLPVKLARELGAGAVQQPKPKKQRQPKQQGQRQPKQQGQRQPEQQGQRQPKQQGQRQPEQQPVPSPSWIGSSCSSRAPLAAAGGGDR
jgi:hypothetical protein